MASTSKLLNVAINNFKIVRFCHLSYSSLASAAASETPAPPSSSETSKALVAVKDRGVLPEKFQEPDEAKCISYSRTELLAQLDGGKSIRVPFRLWRIAIRKCTIPHADYLDLTWQERETYSRHATAVQRRQLTYIDVDTGHKVMTVTALLLQEKCCGNGCRHCPYDHANVPPDVRRKKIFNGAYYL